MLISFHLFFCSSLESFNSQACGGKDWKLILTEWLNLLKLMKNSRSFYRSQLLKEVLVNRFVKFFLLCLCACVFVGVFDWNVTR